ncbi:MAG TPA: hydrogenase expression/formation protein HypE [Gaiellaceae bacterium]|nr:hydrogenase expression/formation protein HypE [Gaiellaceae bacterium]
MRPRAPRLRDEVVTLAHGAGGRATAALVDRLFLEELRNPLLEPLGDAALLAADGLGGARLALTTDSYVVKPLSFPGGGIGELAVNGTVNDLAVSGARPLALSAGFVVEEGFPVAELRRVAAAMAAAARAAGVPVAAGDTKVVERGKADGLYLNTAGVGVVAAGVALGPERARPGDRVLVSGTIGDHGVAVLVARGELALEADLASDTAPVLELASALLELGPALRFMRDPTRGGLATTLNELAAQAGLAVRIAEDALPVRREVAGACELLGLDPLYVANEGKLVAVVAPEAAEEALARLRALPLGAEAALVGTVEAEPEGLVVLDTRLGGGRIVDMLVGDPLPRIC